MSAPLPSASLSATISNLSHCNGRRTAHDRLDWDTGNPATGVIANAVRMRMQAFCDGHTATAVTFAQGL